MHVILTHEQADFDALAALLGAYLLQDRAIPVLPRRANRNVRAFINLYGTDLPFTDPRDLPQGPIDRITLVDTQSLITLRGTGEHTQVDVVDHHNLRSDLPEEWSVTIEKTGATTTLFVEGLQEHNSALTPIQATLLLLGIYEDTGSLTYTSTTPRDIRAAAYLLEQGASLRIASEYLNPTLSSEQSQIYERLLASMEWHSIHGQNIIIACASAEDTIEEISSVAHKMRDLLDPDALFLLVSTAEGIRLVARGTSDRINVADVAAHFGGGGHERAAAALIKVKNEDEVEANFGDAVTQLSDACSELTKILAEKVRPAITIGQIMSKSPRVLSPQTLAQEAAQLMQRYGYEGYPVVKDTKVIGLLTRRAVDRAISHKLNLPAISLMEAGEVTVQPNQPIEHLQQVMTTSGWGQVPVVDPNSGGVIGIVTRTDLLKTLAFDPNRPARQNLSIRLEAALPASRLALLHLVAQQAYDQRVAVYIVGGFVRDLLLERPSLDFDLVIEGDAISLARSLSAKYGGQVVSHSRFGTAKWNIAEIKSNLVNLLHKYGVNGRELHEQDLPESLDLITARTEFYEHPSALPTVERSSIKWDLHRRDFTMNTLALRLDGRHYGELHDYWGALKDLELRQVRVLHSLSFIDDPTRLLRAVRFEQRFGFQIEERTLQLMDEAHLLLRQVSGDRIRHEIELILAEEKTEEMLKRLASLGILDAIHNDLPDHILGPWRAEPPMEWQIPEKYAGIPIRRVLTYLMWLGKLEPNQVQSISSRLKFTSALRNILITTCKLCNKLPGLVGSAPSNIATELDDIPSPALYALHQISTSADERKSLYTYVTEWKNIHPITTGDMLRDSGIPPGPIYRDILTALRNAWLDAEIQNEEQENRLLNQLLHKL